ncbi:hypothetical protein CUR178_07931 [Leishmania enriettii]|uniref:Uncharacterized protein n=1 Tax=Leishmania enriettii TaxID=5663 RepID=A0A836H840_LEIEN|nr:hypothetical protein CUR178_07931 [Leishmania enriettii]
MGLRCASEGLYALCIRQDHSYVSSLLHDSSVRAIGGHFTASYAATPLRLRVAREWSIFSVTAATVSSGSDNIVAITQSSNAELLVTGTAIGVRGVPVLFAFAPPSAQTLMRPYGSSNAAAASSAAEGTVTTSSVPWTWSDGCAAVPEEWDPVTGMSLVSASVSSTGSEDGLLLTAPWRNAHDGVLRVDAAYVSRVEWDAANVGSVAAADTNSTTVSPGYTDPLQSYALCYSADGGLSFRAAGTAARTSSRSLAAVVVPPPITSLSCNRTAAAHPTQRQLGWFADSATATTVRVQYLYTSAGADASITSSPHVVSCTRGDGTESMAYPTRPPTYTYAWTNAFVGNGIGPASGRRLPTVTATAADVPAIAAAVALVRISRYGARCDGAVAMSSNFTPLYSTTVSGAGARNASAATAASPLAMSIFLMNLQYGGVWSTAGTAAVAAWREAQTAERVAQFERRNPALSQEAWVNQTVALWARYEDVPAPPLNGQSILGRATDAATAASRGTGESLVVCRSVDGTHFYSADVARAAALTPEARAQQRVVIAAPATESSSTTTVTHVSPRPLYLRAVVAPTTGNVIANSTAPSLSRPFLWMREVSMVMELLPRPTAATIPTSIPAAGSDSPYLDDTSASLALFQEAMAAALGVDLSVVTVQLHMSAFVDLPKAVESAAVAAVQARHSAAGTVGVLQMPATDLTHSTTADTSPSLQPLLLPTYAQVLSISADAMAHNATANTSTLSAAPELLNRSVELLRNDASGPALLAKLARSHDAVAALSLSSLTVNFTLRNGVNLHDASTTMSAVLPSSSAQEVVWRRLFLSIPHCTLRPSPVRDDRDKGAASKVKWWIIPLLLVVPGTLVLGTHHVYKKYLKPADDPSVEPVVENVQ